MMLLEPRAVARAAVSARAERPATAILLDVPDARLVVFRIAAGQAVPPHDSPSTVLLTVLEGCGLLSGANGEEAECGPGTVVAYEPGEVHGMRALGEELLLLATITPRPGARPAPAAPEVAAIARV